MIKSKLLSVFELSLFMVDGFNRFENDKKQFIYSFGVAFLSLPFIILSIPYLREFKEDLLEISVLTATIMMVVKYFFSIAVLTFFSYYLCKLMKKKDRFFKFVTVTNWMTLTPLVLFIPFLILMMNGIYMYEQAYPFLVIVALYSYVLTAFVIRYVIDIPWELSVFFAICTMAINQFFYQVYFDIVNYL